MATKTHGETTHPHRQIRSKWEALAGDDVGNWMDVSGTPDITMYASGNIDGGTLTIQCSPDNGTTVFTAKEDDGSSAAVTVLNDAINIRTLCPYIRPIMVGGGGSTDVDVVVVAGQGGR